MIVPWHGIQAKGSATLTPATHYLGGHPARLGIGGHVYIVSGTGVESHPLHGLLYYVAHLQESAPAFKEPAVDHLVGRIEHTRHIATTPYGLESESETTEFLHVWLEELKSVGKEVKPL